MGKANFDDCQVVRILKGQYKGEYALLIGKWMGYNKKTWDGSYIILHNDNCVGFWFPKMFKKQGYTYSELTIAINKRNKKDMKENRDEATSYVQNNAQGV